VDEDGAEIIGRDEDLQTLSSFLEQRVGPGALLIEGNAGIGKTTLWRLGVERAEEQGWHVLTAGPAPSEARLELAAIGDLLGGVVDTVLPRLPSSQRNALEVALLLEEAKGSPPGERAVADAVHGAVRVLAHEGPLLLAVDDLQWLDRPSADVLSFVARRLGEDPVALLLAERTEHGGVPHWLDRAFGERLRHVRLRPLSLGATHRLLRSRLDLTLPRPSLHRVHAACGGNPMFALEIGRVVKETPDVLRSDEPLPVPQEIEHLVGRRIQRLSEAGREAVLAAALLAGPTVRVVEEAASRTGLEEAVNAGVLVVAADALRFAHPLLAEAATLLALESRRREMHVRLAALVADPESQAQHLALGTTEPNAEAAETLDHAAAVAHRRGARSSAAAFAEHAARLTPQDDLDAVARRTTIAAHWWTDAGDTGRSLALIDPLLDQLVPATGRRLEAFHAKARAVEDRRVFRAIVEEALAEADGYPNQRVIFLFGLCSALNHALEFDGAREWAPVAVEAAGRADDPSVLVLALGMAGGLNVGRGCLETLHQALALERKLVEFDAYDSPKTWLGLWMLANDEVDEARRLLLEQHGRAVEQGDDWSRTWLHSHLTELECRAGNYEAARTHAETGLELAEQSGRVYALDVLLCSRALVAAHVGDAETARTSAEASLAAAERIHSELDTVRPRTVLAFLAVSEGNYAEALQRLEGLSEVALKGPYWATSPFWSDLFEALVSLGEVERARALLAEIEAHRHVFERPGTAPVIARCRGLVLAASGSLEESLASLEEALRLHQAHPVPFERARTLLALGEVQRRAKKRRAARETLEEARAVFESLGAQLWQQRANDEIARIGGRAPSRGPLTATELRLAELVAAGSSNKEAAAALFVTPKTVETQLSRIYAKLEIHSRAELARRFAESNL
jgi:DNA-binding CsgD family transcriptional regulator